MGRPSGARFRTFTRLKGYAERIKGTLFDNPELLKAVDEIYRYPLRQTATDTLNRQLRAGINDEDLAELGRGVARRGPPVSGRCGTPGSGAADHLLVGVGAWRLKSRQPAPSLPAEAELSRRRLRSSRRRPTLQWLLRFPTAGRRTMRSPYTQLYLHIVWATWDRLPLITETIKPRLNAAIAEKCRELKCVPLAVGGIADHVHLLVRLHTTVAVATLAKEVKGASSHL